jgi:hypothetical protein
VRHGPSLLQGLLICGKCGHRMQVRYGGPNKLHTYTCSRLATDYAEGYCHYLPGVPVDEFVGGWVLKALEPAALELSRWRPRNTSRRSARSSTGYGASVSNAPPTKRRGPAGTTA